VKVFDFEYQSKFQKNGKERIEILNYGALPSLGKIDNVAIELEMIEKEKETLFDYIQCKGNLYETQQKKEKRNQSKQKDQHIRGAKKGQSEVIKEKVKQEKKSEEECENSFQIEEEDISPSEKKGRAIAQ